MARINIEDDIESNEEFWHLLKIIGGDRDAALGKLVRFFRLCQMRFGRGQSVSFELIRDHGLNCMIESKWAVPFKDGFQVKGAEKHFEWYAQKVDAGRRGGLSKSLGKKVAHAKRDVAHAYPPSPSPSLNTKKIHTSSGDDSHPLAQIWNKNCGKLARVKGCTKTRLRKAEALWKSNPSTEYWSEIVSRLAASDFCNGTGKTSWRAGFDFLLQPETQNKVLEGNYDNRKKQTEINVVPLDLKANA